MIWREDPPGSYQHKIQWAKNISNKILTKMVSSVTGTEFMVTHDSKGQHTFSWSSPVLDPNGTELPPGSVCTPRPFLPPTPARCPLRAAPQPHRDRAVPAATCRYPRTATCRHPRTATY